MSFRMIACDWCSKPFGYNGGKSIDWDAETICSPCFEKWAATRQQSGVGYTFSPLLGRIVEMPIMSNTEYTTHHGLITDFKPIKE